MSCTTARRRLRVQTTYDAPHGPGGDPRRRRRRRTPPGDGSSPAPGRPGYIYAIPTGHSSHSAVDGPAAQYQRPQPSTSPATRAHAATTTAMARRPAAVAAALLIVVQVTSAFVVPEGESRPHAVYLFTRSSRVSRLCREHRSTRFDFEPVVLSEHAFRCRYRDI